MARNDSSMLDSRIQAIADRAARDLVAAVRQEVAAQVDRMVPQLRRARAEAERSARRAAHGEKARPARAGTPKGRGRRRKLETADIDRVLEVVTRTPGLRAEEIYRELPEVPSQLAKEALAVLRRAGAVVTGGQARATTYSPA